MSSENVQPLIASWSLSSKYNNGPRVEDRLAPPKYKRINTLHTTVWREEACSSTLNWGTQHWSYLFPQSLQVVSSAFLRIQLPAVQQGNYKKCVGLNCVKSMRLLSAGNTVYEITDLKTYLRDYMESLTDEEFKVFAEAYLGGADESAEARDVYIPILLPNSGFALRHGASGANRGLGVWPADLGASQRLEVQITMCGNDEQNTDSANATPDINAGACVMAIREVKMSQSNLQDYKNHRGRYSTISRRFTDLTTDWEVAEADTKRTLLFNQPSGSISEIQIIAVPFDADKTKRDYLNSVQPSQIKFICDAITVRDFNRASKIRLHNYKNGFVNGSSVKPIGRICFGSHSSESSHTFTGAFNFSNVSQIKLECTFPEKVDFKVVAVQLQCTQIDQAGVITSYLD